MALIAPSLLSCNFLQLQAECEMINNSQADWFHIDVMDGSFVPNISFGLPLVEHIAKVAKKPLDVHLMIVKPEQYIESFKQAGAHILTIHYEASVHLHRSLMAIKQLGMQAGIAINPHTPVQLLFDVLYLTDVVCIMSVNPGFGGQSFIEHTYQKVQQLKQFIVQHNLSTIIEIDGGVTLHNASLLVQAGADVLVAGNTVFKATNPTQVIQQLKQV